MTTTLNLFADSAHNLSLTDLIGTSVAVLGMTGSGKSNTTARLTEQLLAAGVATTVIDIAGEHYGLKERFPLVVAGKSVNVDIELSTPAQAGKLAEWSLDTGTSIVLDLRDYRRSERTAYVVAYLDALWMAAARHRKPHTIVLEEAHNYIPQSGTTDASDIVTTIATEGRKQGLGIVMLSQRPARIDKDVLSQASIRILHRVFDANDIKAYQAVMPLSASEVKAVMTTLGTGQAMLVYPARNICERVDVLRRETYHGGFTPGLGTTHAPQLTALDSETLALLKAALGGVRETPAQDAAALLAEKDQLIAALEAEIGQLREQNEMLSKLVVTLPESANGVAVAPVQWSYDVPQVHEVYRSDLATTRAINKQRREFDALLNDVRGCSVMHRRLFKYLLQHSNLSLTRHQLARYLGYQADTLAKSPPSLLLQRGLIQRTMIRGQQHYSASKTEDALHQMFPDFQTDLTDALISACGKVD